MSFFTMVWEWLHSLPSLAKFALGMAIIVGIPQLSRRARLPAVVGESPAGDPTVDVVHGDAQ